ncbi:MAG TPA: serine hydrolase [bacterium]|nr:serine hydrolase [bacterium]
MERTLHGPAATPAARRFPPPGHWPTATPEAVGLDPAGIADAVAYAQAHESTRWPRRMVDEHGRYPADGMADKPEWAELLGPVRPHEAPHGVIVRHGALVAQWGPVERVDMTFSISKSYLALLALLALQRGLIHDLSDRVRDYDLDDGFEAAQNRDITWEQLLLQTSEWEGTLFDKPDLADRNREIGGDDRNKGTFRELQTPGTHWEYNDVRVNRLSLSLLRLFKRPLTEVLREAIMEPIGASDTWEWPHYRNAVVDVTGMDMPSIPGGAHWGGGLWINSLDHARMAWLVLNGGNWAGREVLRPDLVARLSTQAPGNPNYGYLWWLNTGRTALPAAPEGGLFCRGAGTHLIWLDAEQDLVLVSRWVDSPHWNPLIERIMGALRD